MKLALPAPDMAALLLAFKARMDRRVTHVALAQELMKDFVVVAAEYVDDPAVLAEQVSLGENTNLVQNREAWSRVEAALADDWADWRER